MSQVRVDVEVAAAAEPWSDAEPSAKSGAWSARNFSASWMALSRCLQPELTSMTFTDSAARLAKNMSKGKRARSRGKSGNPKIRRARCSKVLAILANRIETVDLLREEEYEPLGDFPDGPIQVAVVRFRDLDVRVALDTVVFLK
jgi:hypothetical protein